MSTDVLMPQMGESVAEGTIVRWIKRVGEAVDKDEPLFEISTDKVDAEIPAPEAGVLAEIKVHEGETVPVHSVVAVISGTASTTSTASTPSTRNELPLARSNQGNQTQEAPRAERPHLVPVVPDVPAVRTDRLRTRSSPVVRKIAAAHNIDISRLTGTGISGRVTRRDIQAFVERGGAGARMRPSGPPAYLPGENVRLEKMSVMRRKIAEHMLASIQTSPHVYSAYEIDFSRVDELRRKHKSAFEAKGTKLTYTAFIARATVDAIKECPYANASIDGDTIVYKQDINLGIAVALEQGLIVPVIRHADRLTMAELCGTLQDLAERARTKHLKVEEVQGATFTITNPGVFGALFGFPIISQPQVAILCVGSVDKRAVVVDDAIVARTMCYMTLGHDHRLIDGAEGARFLQVLRQRLEHFDEALL